MSLLLDDGNNPFDPSKREEIKQKVIEQTIATFDEDRDIIHAQYETMQNVNTQTMVDIHADVAANRAGRIIQSLL